MTLAGAQKHWAGKEQSRQNSIELQIGKRPKTTHGDTRKIHALQNEKQKQFSYIAKLFWQLRLSIQQPCRGGSSVILFVRLKFIFGRVHRCKILLGWRYWATNGRQWMGNYWPSWSALSTTVGCFSRRRERRWWASSLFCMGKVSKWYSRKMCITRICRRLKTQTHLHTFGNQTTRSTRLSIFRRYQCRSIIFLIRKQRDVVRWNWRSCDTIEEIDSPHQRSYKHRLYHEKDF